MGLDKAKALLEEAQVFFVSTNATIGPQTRPFGVYLEYQGDLYILTNKEKAVYKQIVADNRVQLSANLTNHWFRINAKAIEGSPEIVTLFNKKYPFLKDIENDGTVAFALKDAILIEYLEKGEPVISKI